MKNDQLRVKWPKTIAIENLSELVKQALCKKIFHFNRKFSYNIPTIFLRNLDENIEENIANVSKYAIEGILWIDKSTQKKVEIITRDVIKRGDREIWLDFMPGCIIIILFDNKKIKLRSRHTISDDMNLKENKNIGKAMIPT